MIQPMMCPVCHKPVTGTVDRLFGGPDRTSEKAGDTNIAGAEVLQPHGCGAEVLPPRKRDCLPFCSERCRSIDLFRWFDGRYAIVEDLSEQQLAEAEFENTDLSKTPDADF